MPIPDIKQKGTATNKGVAEPPEGQSASVKPDIKSHNGGGAAPTSKMKDTLQIVSTILSIVGGLGTLFVWCAATFYVGDIELIADKPYQNLNVDVFNEKGQATSYHVNKFQLMPGKYHIEVSADGQSKRRLDVDVHFNRTEEVNFCLSEGNQLETSREPNAAKALAPSQSTPDSHGTTDGLTSAIKSPEPDRSSAESKLDGASAESGLKKQLTRSDTATVDTKSGSAEQTKPSTAYEPNVKNGDSANTAASASTTDVVDTPSAEEKHHHWWQSWHKKANQQKGG